MSVSGLQPGETCTHCGHEAEALPATELNPNHPVIREMEGQWAKIVALLLYRDGVQRATISPDVVTAMLEDQTGHNIAIKFDDREGIILLLVDDKEAARLAREEGGLPA